MTQWNGCRIGLAAVLGLAMSAGSGLAGEEKISREDLPKAVRKAVAEKFPKAKIRGVSKEVEHGKTTFEVEMTIKDRSVDAVFNAKGKVLEIEKEIPVSKLPRKVREELEEHFPGAKIEKAEAVTRGEHGPVVYEVDLEAVLTADGKIVRGHEEADEEEEHEHHAAEGKKEHKGHGEASCACCAKGESSCKECKKHHDDRDDDDDDDAEEHEHHAKAGEKHEHKGHGEAHAKGEHKGHGEAHAKGKKQHDDRDDDDDDDDDDAEEHEHHAKAGAKEKHEHKGHGDAKSKGEKHDHDDDEDDDR